MSVKPKRTVEDKDPTGPRAAALARYVAQRYAEWPSRSDGIAVTRSPQGWELHPSCFWTLSNWERLCDVDCTPVFIVKRLPKAVEIQARPPRGHRFGAVAVREFRKIIWSDDDGTADAKATPNDLFCRVDYDAFPATISALLDLAYEHLESVEGN